MTNAAPATPPPERRRNLLPIVIVGGAVASAALLLALRLRIQPPTVPPYVLDVSDAKASVLASGDFFHMDIEPQGIVTGAVGAHAFLVRGDEARIWEPEFEVERDGSVHLAGRVEKLFAGVPAGTWDIAIVVGRPETLPTSPREALHVRDGGPAEAAWRLVEQTVVLGAPSGR
ncbi:MAG TPA: hypothetical protein VGG39_33860 [Polyangiaceae bacterium]